MTIEKIIEKATINFPKPLCLKATEELLKYIAESISANINYHAGYFNNLNNKEGIVTSDMGTINITGTITRLSNPIAFDSFEIFPYRNDTTKADKMQFTMVPAWDLTDYQEQNLELWEDVRTVVDKYFSQ
ncbi:MAG: hypothetical protein KKF46_02960 [Nanoarchaeota archaeon]|nr:hypothetical protein [Nanoarchaeota archaeon]MBU1321293.1 hypothetical protein [Nanoarchaeota archaeon]MBU1597462.1 hypothetical protein [Nanoarchaeota archaeon]MBU2441465.1 hypothetical protein [Nanoarchaeota archaeon]